MIAWAAIDLRGGRVVQLVGGKPDEERVSLPDPAAVAAHWMQNGFTALHVVDLDAALGTGDNSTSIEDVLTAAAGSAAVNVGGGVRTSERVRELIERGAAGVVVGTRAILEPAWLEELAGRHPGRIIVAADIRGAEVVVRGWTEGAGLSAEALLDRIAPLPLAGVLVTDVAREGRMTGVDADRYRRLVAASAHPLLASGGVGSAADVALLERTGAAGVVLGMALYTGALDPRALTGDAA